MSTAKQPAFEIFNKTTFKLVIPRLITATDDDTLMLYRKSIEKAVSFL